MGRPPAVHLPGALAGACLVVGLPAGVCLLLGAGGCATGSSLSQQDASLRQSDGLFPQLDGPRQDDAPAQLDAAEDTVAPLDGPKDAPLDGSPDGPPDSPPQQDAQTDTLPQSDVLIDTAPQCAIDSDCYPDSGMPDGGIYCFLPKGACYTPGWCSTDWECPNGSVCKPMFLQCSCNNSFPFPLLCRDHEVCVPLFQACAIQ